MNIEKPEVNKEYYRQEHRGMFFFMNPELPGWFVGGRRSLETMKLCDGTRTGEQIVNELENQFELPRDELEKELACLLETLGKNGFLKGIEVEPPKYEQSLDTLYLHLTRNCTLRCKYCYVEGGTVPENELTTEEIKNVIDQAKALNRVQMLVAITGGEPMMHPDFWEIADYIKSKGSPMCLATNGTLVTEENAHRLKEYFYNIQVSLDGPPEVHDAMRGKGSYDKAVEAMRYLVKAGCSVMISGVVSRHNLETIYHIVDVAAELGITNIKTGIFLPFGKGAEERELALTEQEFTTYWHRIQQAMQEKLSRGQEVRVVNDASKLSFLQPIYTSTHSCGAVIGALSIDSDGGVYPCQSAHLPEFLMGNVREQPLEKIWKESEVAKQWCGLTIDKLEDCTPCAWRKYCGGGCRMQAYAFSGRLDKPVMFCGFLKGFFPDAVEKYIEYVKTRNHESG